MDGTSGRDVFAYDEHHGAEAQSMSECNLRPVGPSLQIVILLRRDFRYNFSLYLCSPPFELMKFI